MTDSRNRGILIPTVLFNLWGLFIRFGLDPQSVLTRCVPCSFFTRPMVVADNQQLIKTAFRISGVLNEKKVLVRQLDQSQNMLDTLSAISNFKNVVFDNVARNGIVTTCSLMLDSKNEEQAAAIPVWTMVPVLLEPFSAQRISFAYIFVLFSLLQWWFHFIRFFLGWLCLVGISKKRSQSESFRSLTNNKWGI